MTRSLFLFLLFGVFAGTSWALLVPYASAIGPAGPLVPERCQTEPCPLSEGSSFGPLAEVVANVFNWLVVVGGAASVFAVVIAGTRYIVAVLSGADSGAIQAAKQSLGLAVLGVFLLLLSYVIVRTIATILGASNFFQ